LSPARRLVFYRLLNTTHSCFFLPLAFPLAEVYKRSINQNRAEGVLS
jgi:hypothetical protein